MTPISINRTQGGHIIPKSLIRIVERYNCGNAPTAIALGFNLAHSSEAYTLEESLQRGNNTSIAKAPRRKSYIYVEERNILRYARPFPKATYCTSKNIRVSPVRRVLLKDFKVTRLSQLAFKTPPVSITKSSSPKTCLVPPP
jgi:hypothetical protein